jgi:hypothetical protein
MKREPLSKSYILPKINLEFPQNVIASEAKQSIIAMKNGLLRRFAPRNDVCLAKLFVNIEIPT